MRTLALLVAVVLLAAGTARAAITQRREVTFPAIDRVDSKIVSRFTAQDANDTRRTLDTDDDGRVSPAEARNLTDEIRASWDRSPPGLAWRLDGVRLDRARLRHVEDDGLVGPVRSHERGLVTVVFTAAFPGVQDAVNHQMQFPDLGPCKQGETYPWSNWTIHAPADHRIDEVNRARARIDADRGQLEIECGPALHGPLGITFTRIGGPPPTSNPTAAAPGTLGVLAMLALAVVLARR